MRFSLALPAVIVVAVSLIWGVGAGFFALGGVLLGLLLGALWRTLSESVEDRLERHRREQD